MTSVDIIIWVDTQVRENGKLNHRQIENYILSKCGDTEHSRLLRMTGIARLAGSAQCRYLRRKHKRLIEILKSEYWGNIK